MDMGSRVVTWGLGRDWQEGVRGEREISVILSIKNTLKIKRRESWRGEGHRREG